MLYLADWKNCLINQNQLSDINWYYNTDGPFANEVINLLEEYEQLGLIKFQNDEEKSIAMSFTSNVEAGKYLDFGSQEKSVLNFVIEKTKELNWQELNKLVNSTYPMIKNSKFSTMNLIESSAEYELLKNKPSS
jgi:hypothetical protein